METTTMASVVVMVIAALAGLGFFLASLYSANRKVEKYLLERGATDVAVHYELFDLDRDTATFTVRYTGISGERRQTHHIDDQTCIRCGICAQVCNFNAISILS